MSAPEWCPVECERLCLGCWLEGIGYGPRIHVPIDRLTREVVSEYDAA